jgi:plastocyanin
MLLSRNNLIGFAVAIVGIAIMGLIVFGAEHNAGIFHQINKAQAQSSFPPVHVKIVTNPNTIGQYVPASITVHPGQHVIFTNDSNATHTVTERADNGWDSKDIDTGGHSWTLIAPSKAGAYQYYCTYHPFMTGKVIVTG